MGFLDLIIYVLRVSTQQQYTATLTLWTEKKQVDPTGYTTAGMIFSHQKWMYGGVPAMGINRSTLATLHTYQYPLCKQEFLQA